MASRSIRLLTVIGASLAIFTGLADAAEIRVIASAAVKEICLELVPQFEKTTGNTVVTTWSGTSDIMKRIKAGEPADLVIVGADSIDELIALNKIVPGSRASLMRSGIGAAVRAGAPKPDISSGDALKRTLLAAKSIGYSSGPSGVYLDQLYQRMGITDELKPKLRQPPSGGSVGEMIARGEVEIGFQQVSELKPVAGIDFLGPLSPDVQSITVFSGGIHVGARDPAAAAALAAFLRSAAAAPIISSHGMEPG